MEVVMGQSKKDLILIAIWSAIVISLLAYFADTKVLIGVIGWFILLRLHIIDTDIASLLKHKQ
jgi:hypothetical protein